MRRLTLAGTLIVLALSSAALAGNGYVDALSLPDGLSYVGSESCLDCHEDVAELSTHTPHAADALALVPGTAIGTCEACHGPGSAHVAEEGDGPIMGGDMYAAMDADTRLAMCTQCHTAKATHWFGGPHDGADISCNDCHADQVHFGGQAQPAASFRNPSEFCLQCHPAQTGDFRLPFRHRVLENQVSCNDCHNPHAAPDPAAMNPINESCLGCHQEMAGPFVFEHEGVSGEDCTACHKPHGSNHDKLLVTEGNSLCLQCHYDAEFSSGDGWAVGDVSHGGFALGNEGRCYDCHTEIHGSNVAATFRDQ